MSIIIGLSIGGLLIGSLIANTLLLPFTHAMARKSVERKYTKIRDRATKGMTEEQKMIWDIFN